MGAPKDHPRKPCPFCGATASFVECMELGSYAVVCNDCRAVGPIGEGNSSRCVGDDAKGEWNATRKWNKRT